MALRVVASAVKPFRRIRDRTHIPFGAAAAALM
jgi:hypothetical protein